MNHFMISAALGAAILMTSAPDSSPAQEKSVEPLTPEQAMEEYAYAIGVQAYIYGYPSVELYRVRYKAVFNPGNKTRTPLNRFRHRRELLDPAATTVVAPNNDTLYSSAWLDLAKEPVVLDVPDTKSRYYVMQFMDFYTNNFAYVGKRTTGTKAASYAITGPGWTGKLPAGIRRIESPTNDVWLLGRTLVDGPNDLPAVHALQDQYLLTPLSAWHKKKDAKMPDEKGEPPAYDASEPLKFFEFLNIVLHENPPPAREAALMSLFGRIGVGPDRKFKAAELDPSIARGLHRAIDTGQQLIASLPSGRPEANGWLAFSPHTGKFGDDYRYRAYIAKYALASNDPQEAYNFSTGRDDQSRPLSGDRNYVLRFEKGQLPPVDAFWSVTMYQLPGVFLVESPIQRYALGDRSQELRHGTDGSLDIYLQHDSPGADKISNWLPAPRGDFELALRCYLPHKEISEGVWLPPKVKSVE